MDNTSFSPSVQLRGEASVDAELIACFIENLIRRLRCIARTVKSDGICITRDAMRSPFSRISDENRQERYCAGGASWDLQSYFIREREELDRSTFPSTAECRLSVSEFLPKLHTKFYERVESSFFDDRINLSSANKIREYLRVGLY